MAIEINKPGKDTVNPPQINLTGKWINSTTGKVASTSGTISIGSQDIEQSGLEVTNREEIIFFDKIDVILTPDAEWKAHTHVGLRKYDEIPNHTKILEGSPETKTRKSHNEKSETYYTLNGKAPKRTKENLYTGPFTIRRNTSGDNIVLKARTYVAGQKSKVRTLQLRLIKKSALAVND